MVADHLEQDGVADPDHPDPIAVVRLQHKLGMERDARATAVAAIVDHGAKLRLDRRRQRKRKFDRARRGSRGNREQGEDDRRENVPDLGRRPHPTPPARA